MWRFDGWRAKTSWATRSGPDRDCSNLGVGPVPIRMPGQADVQNRALPIPAGRPLCDPSAVRGDARPDRIGTGRRMLALVKKSEGPFVADLVHRARHDRISEAARVPARRRL